MLLSKQTLERYFPGQSQSLCEDLVAYLVRHKYYQLVTRAIVGIVSEVFDTILHPTLTTL